MNIWQLPKTAVFGSQCYTLHTDYRDILEIMDYFQDPDLPLFMKWQIALGLFYEEPIPTEQEAAAMTYLAQFLNGGEQPTQRPGPKLLDWQQDASVIVADINKVAGQEIRQMPYVHWWTFLAWFHAIEPGRLSTIVSIRDKLTRGKKLEEWEKSFYRDHKKQVDLKKNTPGRSFRNAKDWRRC